MKYRYCCYLAVAVAAGLFLTYYFIGAQSFSALRVSKLENAVSEGEQITIEGMITRKFRKEEGIDFLLQPLNQKELVYVSLPKEQATDDLEIGQKVKASGEVILFNKSPNLGNFNQKFYYQKQNIYVKLQDAHAEIQSRKLGQFAYLKEQMWKLQQKLSKQVIAYAGEHYGGILSAMLIGEDFYVDAELKELMQKSGIGHLLAISGLHVSFLGAGTYKIQRKAGIPIVVAAICSGIFLSLYILMIGNSVSACRAWLMFLLQMGANVTGREYDGKTALAFAALCELLQEPVRLFDASFLLSFGAVAGIYVVAPALEMKIPLAIQCVLFPVQLYYYYEICIYSLIWNFFAIPLSSIAMGSGILGIICAKAPFLPKIFVEKIFAVGKGVVWFYEIGGKIVLNLPFSRWITGQPPFLCLVIYYTIVVVVILFWKKKWPILIAGVLLIIGTRYLPDACTVTMLDVGQGDCFIINSPDGSTFLVDGGSSSVAKVGQYRIEPYLKHEGIGSVDYVWVTHGDSDHMNGILELLERKQVGIRIKHLILPPQTYWNENMEELVEAAQRAKTEIHVMKQGQVLKEGPVKIKCLWPPEEDNTLDENQASLVLGFAWNSFDLLFTGDLEKDAEKRVAEYILADQKKQRLPEKYEVLKVGHHGSKNSTSETFLALIRPEISLISAGENNRYGHPHEETVDRIEKAGSKVASTIKNGMIRLKLCEDGHVSLQRMQ